MYTKDWKEEHPTRPVEFDNSILVGPMKGEAQLMEDQVVADSIGFYSAISLARKENNKAFNKVCK